MTEHYRGWDIYQGPPHPVTGQWRALRAGVRMGAGTKEALMRMIDQRVTDEREQHKGQSIMNRKEAERLTRQADTLRALIKRTLTCGHTITVSFKKNAHYCEYCNTRRRPIANSDGE